MPKRSSSRTFSNKPLASPPPPAVPQKNSTISQSPSMMDTIKQGFAFGVGSSIGNNIVNSIFNSKSTTTNNTNNSDIANNISSPINEPIIKISTDKMYKLYNKCLEENNTNINCSDILEKTNSV
jgi:hypothetical protein